VDAVKAAAEVAGQGVGCSDGVVVGLDFDGAVAAGVRTNFLMDQPVRASIQRLMARAANTLTTKPDHNGIRQEAIPADAPVAAAPGERLFPTI
jgi:hypothetical protein